jgi:PAS domain S-box-containing protein
MGDKPDIAPTIDQEAGADLTTFTDSYASFNRIVNSLQRKYIDLKEEFSTQQQELVETNLRLVEMTTRNLAATEFLDSILNSMAAGVIAVDRNGRITNFNPAASVMLGVPRAEPLGQPYREMILAGEPIEANALRAVESGRTVDSVEKTWNLTDGTRLIVSVSTAILTDRKGRALGAVEVFHDLTKIKKMEHEITRLTTLAALGEMAATVAHQVRNPLSGILGYGSLLRRDMDADDPRQKLVTRICDGVETLNKTVTTLLDFTRQDEVRRTSVDFGEFIDETIRQFRRDHDELASQAKIVSQVDRSSAPVDRSILLDPVLFRQVLFNLFCNSCQSGGGEASIAVTGRKLPRQTAVSQYAGRLLLGLDETVFEITVSDDGPGIPDCALEELFAPFFTTREGGTGLGLAVAWKIVKGHGGDIALDLAYEGGARFVLLLPARIGTDADHSKDIIDMESHR